MATKYKNYSDIPYSSLTGTDESLIFKFKDLDSLLTNLTIRKQLNIRYSSLKDSNQSKSNGFNDTDSLEDAIKRLKENPKISKEAIEIKKLIKKNKIIFEEEPQNLIGIDIPSYLGGKDYFINKNTNKKYLKKKAKINIIYLNLGVLATVTAEKLKINLNKLLLHIYNNFLFDKMVIMYEITDLPIKLFLEIPKKEFKNIFKIAFADFHRRIVFFYREQTSKLPSGYGSSVFSEKESIVSQFDKHPHQYYNINNMNLK